MNIQKPTVCPILSLEHAYHICCQIIEYHMQRKIRFSSPDSAHALAELYFLSQRAEHVYEVHKSATTQLSGEQYIRFLKEEWKIRLTNYQSDAEYASDVGCLGSVLADMAMFLSEKN